MALPINIHELIHGSTVEWKRGEKPPVNRRIPPDISVQGTKLGLSGNQVALIQNNNIENSDQYLSDIDVGDIFLEEA